MDCELSRARLFGGGMEFQADIVTFELCDDEYIAFAFFRSQKAGAKHYLAISRCLEPGNEGEVALELDDQSRATSGGILEWKLDERRLTLALGDQAAKNLGVVGSPIIIVDFAITRDSWDGLERTLASILGNDTECDLRSGAERVSGTRREAEKVSEVR
jgi:hypothetical protein